MCGAVYKKNPTRAPPVRSVWIELPLFYSKTGFSASSSDRSAPAGGLTFLGAANIRSGFTMNRVLKKTASEAEKIWVPEEDRAERYRQLHCIRTCIE
jgi:hypothetical protein